MNILFASHNPNKKKEIQSMISYEFTILDLNDIGITEEITEDGNTLEENALIKARYLNNKLNMDCIAEDSGLEIESLNGAPGVYSARYAGIPKNDLDNIHLVLENLKNLPNRNAQFRTLIALIYKNTEYLFEGKIKGSISFKPVGLSGFGYDPIFIPEGYNQTFAELGDSIKNKISHRSQAVIKLMNFINSQK